MIDTPVTTALTAFFDRAGLAGREAWRETDFDADWRSVCELSEPEDDKVRWWPVRQASPVDFSGLTNALEVPIHPDICAYYGSFWSGHMEATSREGPLTLIQLWNEMDFDWLVANLIGHALAKQRTGHPLTLFFANTDPDSQLFLSIDNASGKVMLEEPGQPPIKTVDESLVAFIDRLTPRTPIRGAVH
jgi:SecY interacting protein Syd